MMNTSTALVCEMIGTDDSTSEIVFASFNFVESLVNGILAYLLYSNIIFFNSIWMRCILCFFPIICEIFVFFYTSFKFKERKIQPSNK